MCMFYISARLLPYMNIIHGQKYLISFWRQVNGGIYRNEIFLECVLYVQEYELIDTDILL